MSSHHLRHPLTRKKAAERLRRRKYFGREFLAAERSVRDTVKRACAYLDSAHLPRYRPQFQVCYVCGSVDTVIPEDIRLTLELELRTAMNNAGPHLGAFLL